MSDRSSVEQGLAQPTQIDAAPQTGAAVGSLTGLAAQGGNQAFSASLARDAGAGGAPVGLLGGSPAAADDPTGQALAGVVAGRARRLGDALAPSRRDVPSVDSTERALARVVAERARRQEDGAAATLEPEPGEEHGEGDEHQREEHTEEHGEGDERQTSVETGEPPASDAAAPPPSDSAAAAAAAAPPGAEPPSDSTAAAAPAAAGGAPPGVEPSSDSAAGAALAAAGAAPPSTAGAGAGAAGGAASAAPEGVAGAPPAAGAAALAGAAAGVAGAGAAAAGAEAETAAVSGPAGGGGASAPGAAGAAGAAAVAAGPAASAAAPPPVARVDVPPAAFTVPEPPAPEAPGPDEDPGEAMAAQATEQAEIAQDAASAQQAVDAFVGERRGRTDGLAAMRPSMEQAVAAAETEAVTAIDAAAEAQVDQVHETVATLVADVTSQAATLRGQIEAGYEQTAEQARAASERARQAMTEASGSTLARATAAETTQLSRLTALYAQLSGEFRAAADQAGTLAVAEGARRAAEFRSHKINREDGFWDGYLTDNRCDAQAEAAEKVGSSYRDELRKEGDKQATAMNERLPTDEAAVRQVTTETRQALDTTLQQALAGVADAERQSLANAAAARTALLGQVDSNEQSVRASLTQHEAGQVEQLQTVAAERREAVRQGATETMAALAEAVDGAVADVDGGLAMLVSQLNAGPLPEPEMLATTLAEAGGQLDAQMAQLTDGLTTQSTTAADAVRSAGTDAAAALNHAGQAAVDAAMSTGAAARDALTLIGTDGLANLRQLATGHNEAATQSVTGYRTATDALLAGQTAGYERFNTNLQQGARSNVEAVRTGLTDVAQKDIHPVIDEEAAKARAQVLPRWKSVLKWVIIIAIVLVVAIVLGPLVIGAAAGAATALGASALVGTIVGGALVGAATSAVITVIDNGFAGRKLTMGLGTAIVLGAIGGGLGGAAAGLLQGPMQGMTIIGRHATQLAVDMVIDTGMNAATGNLTWENFGTSLAMSVLVNGVTAHPRVSAFSQGLTSRGFGAGYDAAASARARVTGVAGPGSVGPVTSRADHINRGDTAGANSPYGPRWDFRGGGHNAGEFRGRIAGEGGGPTDYRTRTTVEDPVTGVAIDQPTRNRMEMAPGGAGPRQVVDAAGNPVVQSADKSVFPPSMDRPQIAAAGQRAVELAIGGAPGSTHTAPPGPNQNGSFRAIVTTPEGHPILVEGHYRRSPTGQIEIQTVYPVSDRAAGTIPVVPGSRTTVPGAATPADYGYGD